LIVKDVIDCACALDGLVGLTKNADGGINAAFAAPLD